MKKLIPFFILMLVFNCKSTDNGESKSITITSSEVESAVTYLAADERQGRNTGSPGITAAADYISNQLQSYGVNPYFETYRDNFDVNGLDAFNVVGYMEGSDPELKNEVIILGAHYDHIGQGNTVEGDSIANGANDNAAGTSTVLAMAKYFGAKKNNKRSIVFALFSAEEMGLKGSKHLAEALKADNLNLYTMVNFEMIGVPMKTDSYSAYLTGYEMSNMADKINEYAGSNIIGFLPTAKKYGLFRRSDNYPFFNQFKVPCQTISTFDFTNYDYYHHVDDESQLMDYEHMAKLINAVIPAIERMSNTPTKEIVMYEN
ncbi:M28 family metallopeptidase [Psychroserpens sp.]|uniref:M28 family metallopeptidase n=1 Tax=Psychroserpens sp. TaxID=2020870 RepID=UPI001B2C0D20|nr:M20/M25/M40 family metallo-hydrolase [Psychroserpens sp.]MBO6606857.1 M20/M25/M40 family metallo-hydrolase [Psychroserpens sp.]MBO6630367.1 M20/M25/M40 family metallo-hydrolase [Psychroserpens sp.]MBO6654003.1 M20/M25/M40 family metallo-hydrolase [Psychroserpens sp.]MBO6682711.1 M20/M25/M40 family metallo-hydrolase [Psychroserpens sp.]MBO6750629.1 M20/M25/M40 family metallo-hydrolase [Psychroserpens sp.]